jgi:hypothetical protein
MSAMLRAIGPAVSRTELLDVMPVRDTRPTVGMPVEMRPGDRPIARGGGVHASRRSSMGIGRSTPAGPAGHGIRCDPGVAPNGPASCQ